MSGSSPQHIVRVLCLAEALSMTGFAAYPAFLPTLRTLWGLSEGDAGLIGGAFFLGYMVAVPLLSGLTDRFDARGVFVASCALSTLGTGAFGLFADGLPSAVLFQALAGAGLAGTYMPGLKALTDRVTHPKLPRFIAFYTATFGIGTTLSLLVSGVLGSVLDWSGTFVLLACGPAIAALIGWYGLAPHHNSNAYLAAWWPRFGPVLANPESRRYVFGYAAHCWELFGLRSWMVAYIAFAYASTQSTAWLSPTEAAAFINLLGLPASVLGNEVAGRIGRLRWIALMMGGSILLCVIAGGASSRHWLLMLLLIAFYFVAVMGDSAALTAGLVASAPPAQRGAAMALHSFLGFGAGFLAPLIFGLALDRAGGNQDPSAWWLAFITLSLPGMAWLIATRGKRSV